MRVSADNLARTVRAASFGALPEELAASKRAASAILIAETTADLRSAESRFLTNVTETCQPYLRSEARNMLRNVHLYGVASAYVNALPDTSLAVPRIFVFEGLLQNLYYIIHLVRVLERLQKLRPEARFQFEGTDLPEALAFSMAAFSILSDAMAEQRFPPVVHDLLGPAARRDGLSAYRLAVLFVLLHELGHLELGHTRNSATRTERLAVALAEPEALSIAQEEELAADAFAFDHIEPAHRAEFMPSLVFFLTPYTFLEAFSGGLSQTHPLAINRLSALAARVHMPPDAQSIIVGWIEGQLQSLRRMAASREEAGGSLRSRIEERMPVKRAYEVLRLIKTRVLEETGAMDGAPVPMEDGGTGREGSSVLPSAPLS